MAQYQSTSHQSTNPQFPKKTLAIFSLTCCKGCQFELLKNYTDFNQLLNFYDLKNFRLGQEINLNGPFDVALIEGTPESQHEYKLLHEIRRETKIVVAMGACACMGGIQSQRNRLSKKLIDMTKVKPLNEIIKINYYIPGCPINNKEAIRILTDLYWDKKIKISDTSVCFECRLNGNNCLIKQGKPCLGPITRAGCNSICVNGGEACLGCRGPLPQSNFFKMKEILGTMMSKKEVDNWLTFYGDYQKEHRKLINEDNND